ncbi:hypothetical protein [Orientia tsutsugamushi]|uniref:hypothetical protein n=1 Tax=Orientia tsutsugamushi TaxID=784 RepID=UPI000D5A3D54|nr:Uncharacterised protein [Orientia tsutsugamushi]
MYNDNSSSSLEVVKVAIDLLSTGKNVNDTFLIGWSIDEYLNAYKQSKNYSKVTHIVYQSPQGIYYVIFDYFDCKKKIWNMLYAYTEFNNRMKIIRYQNDISIVFNNLKKNVYLELEKVSYDKSITCDNTSVLNADDFIKLAHNELNDIDLEEKLYIGMNSETYIPECVIS